MTYLFLIIFVSYIFGSIPFGYIFTKIFLKKDLRNIGSGNIGATNVLRTGNKVIGYLTLFFDVIKAVIPIIIVKIYYQEYLFISSLSVFVGHLFPLWLNFKGGKGVATYLGILFCINYLLAISFIFIWLIFFIIFKYSSLSSIVSSLTIPFTYYFFINDNNYYFFVIMFILIFFTHRENIKRLINGSENKSKIY